MSESRHPGLSVMWFGVALGIATVLFAVIEQHLPTFLRGIFG